MKKTNNTIKIISKLKKTSKLLPLLIKFIEISLILIIIKKTTL